MGARYLLDFIHKQYENIHDSRFVGRVGSTKGVGIEYILLAVDDLFNFILRLNRFLF